MKPHARRLASARWMAAVCLACATPALAAYHADLARTFAVAPGGKLVVRADRGAIDIKTTGANRVTIKVTRTIKEVSRREADRIFGRHEVTFAQAGDTVTVTARMTRTFHFWPWHRPSLQVHYAITVPRRFDVDLKTFGGSVAVPDLQGGARCQTSGGQLAFDHIAGAVWGKTFGGGITVTAAGGAVEVSSSGGSIDLGEIAGAASAQTFGGSITVKQVKGALTAKTSGGSIQVSSVAGKTFAQTFGGSITIGHAGGQVTAKTSGGNIRIGQAGGAVDARTFSGGITVQKADGNVKAETSGGSIELDRVGGVVVASVFGGSIAAGLGAKPEAPSRMEASGGNIQVRLAPAVAVDLDASAIGGHVTTDLPVTVLGKQSSHGLRGRINGGGVPLRLQTHGGDIYLQKL